MNTDRIRVYERVAEDRQQEKIMEEDLQAHPGQMFDLTIHGIRCQICRTPYGYYCGYILVDDDLSEVVPSVPHGGWTAFNGFDCAHRGDYPMHRQGIFRTYEFVVEELTRIVEQLVDTRRH